MAKKEYIERYTLIRHLNDEIKECGDACMNFRPTAYGTILGLMSARSFANTLPAADVVEVVHAEWDENEYAFCNVCMECGLVIDRTCIKLNSGKLNYCPNCSARMDGGKHG